jgi:predicted MPP superfamily phosphohydrolase
MSACFPFFIVIGLLVVFGGPVSAADSYTYSIMHISDTQVLSSRYPDTLNYTFTSLESMKDEYNISAIVITGDLVDNGSNISQWTNYTNARSLTTVPVYEIPGNHDLNGQADNPLFDAFVGDKYDWNALINDFIFLGIGYSKDPLSDSEIVAGRSFIEENSQKFTLIAAHNFYNEDFSESLLGESIEKNLVLKPTFVLSGHAHATTLDTELINNTLCVEDLTNYQVNGDISAGRLYTVYHDKGEVSKITIRDVYFFPRQYLDPEKTVYDRTGVNNYPLYPENPSENYGSPSSPAVSPSPYSPEYFINPSCIISPVAGTLEMANGIEDALEDRYIHDIYRDDDQGQVVNPSHVISHASRVIFQISDLIEENIRDQYFQYQDEKDDQRQVINPSQIISPNPPITVS